MNEVFLPSILLQSEYNPHEDENGNVICRQIDEANLWHYLNQSGLGRKTLNGTPIKRRINNACSLLAYYDIFKQYYANKQEETAYVIMSGKLKEEITTNVNKIEAVLNNNVQDIKFVTLPDNNSNAISYTIQSIPLIPNMIFKIYGITNNFSGVYTTGPNGEDLQLITQHFIISKKMDILN